MKKLIYVLFLLLHINITYSQTIGNNPNTSSVSSNILGNNNTWIGNNIWTQIGTFQRTTNSAQQVLNLETIGTTGRPFVNFRANSTDYGYLGYGATGSDEMYLYNYRNEKLIFGTNSASRLTIQGNGNIGIGTLVDAGYKLDVNGTSIFRNTLNTSGDAIINGIVVGKGGGSVATNTSLGVLSLNANTTGNQNTSIGSNSQQSNLLGNGNSTLGFGTLYSLTSGSFNTSIGQTSLFSVTTGSNNTSLGVNAGRFIANGSTANTQSDNSVFIGNNAYPNAINESNQIVIGNSAIGLGNNTTVLGNSSTVTTRLFGNLGLNTSSPTHTLTLGQGNTGYTDYNTVDQTVNYERVRKYWSGNVYNISSENGGTGSGRPISITGNSRTFTIGGGNGFFDFLTTTGTAPTGLILTGTSAHSSGSISHILNAPTINQTGTAGYTANKTSVYEQALGSGSKLLLDLGTNTASNGSGTHTSKFNVDNTGYTFLAGITASGSISAQNIVYSNIFNPNSAIAGTSINTVSYNTNTNAINAVTGTMSQTSGLFNGLAIKPVYNQVISTASNTDLLVNRTETSIGSGTQRLLDLQVGGVSKFSVSNAGNTVVSNLLFVNSGFIQSAEYRLASLNSAPTSATDTGVTGQIRITAGFIYVCTATNTWVRSALATW